MSGIADFWRARAMDFRQLARESMGSDVDDVPARLATVCDALGIMMDDGPNMEIGSAFAELVLELAADRWHQREAAYVALVGNSANPIARSLWLAIAADCAALASQLEA